MVIIENVFVHLFTINSNTNKKKFFRKFIKYNKNKDTNINFILKLIRVEVSNKFYSLYKKKNYFI